MILGLLLFFPSFFYAAEEPQIKDARLLQEVSPHVMSQVCAYLSWRDIKNLMLTSKTVKRQLCEVDKPIYLRNCFYDFLKEKIDCVLNQKLFDNCELQLEVSAQGRGESEFFASLTQNPILAHRIVNLVVVGSASEINTKVDAIFNEPFFDKSMLEIKFNSRIWCVVDSDFTALIDTLRKSPKRVRKFYLFDMFHHLQEKIKAIEREPGFDYCRLELSCDSYGGQSVPFITSLAQNINLANRVEGLNFDKNGLSILLPDIGNFTHLQTLSLKENKLKWLPNSIVMLCHLKKLDLSKNELEALPENIGNLRRLEELNLENNKISKLPETFGNLLQLRYLNIASNQLNMPEVIFNFLYLRHLCIAGLTMDEEERIRSFFPHIMLWQYC